LPHQSKDRTKRTTAKKEYNISVNIQSIQQRKYQIAAELQVPAQREQDKTNHEDK